MEPIARITFFLPADKRAELEAIASREDRNLSQLCRIAVQQIIDTDRSDKESAAA